MNNSIFNIQRDYQKMLNIVTIDISKLNYEDSLALLQAVPLYFNYTELTIVDSSNNILNNKNTLLNRLEYKDTIAKTLQEGYAKMIEFQTI